MGLSQLNAVDAVLYGNATAEARRLWCLGKIKPGDTFQFSTNCVLGEIIPRRDKVYGVTLP